MKEAVDIRVQSKDPEKKKGKGDNAAMNLADEPMKDEDLSEEDRKLKEDLDLAVKRLCDQSEEAGVKKLALEVLRREIRTSTSSMTSVPEPLKFLRPSYVTLKKTFETFPEGETKTDLADILAVLAMTMAKEGSRESLKYKLLGHGTARGSWGHEFVLYFYAHEVTKRQLTGDDPTKETDLRLLFAAASPAPCPGSSASQWTWSRPACRASSGMLPRARGSSRASTCAARARRSSSRASVRPCCVRSL